MNKEQKEAEENISDILAMQTSEKRQKEILEELENENIK